MLRTFLGTTIGLLALWGAASGISLLREREDSQRLAHEAAQVLAAPLARAPELSQIPAARAVMLVEEAVGKHDAAGHRGILAWAKALDEFQKNRFDRAKRALSDAQKALPSQAELWVLEAAIALRENQAGSAATAIAHALKMQPKHARARLLAADVAADQNDHARALQLLQALITQEPGIAGLYNRRGLVREALFDATAALADFERAAALDSSLPQPWINVGRLERDRGRMRQAEAAFSQALSSSESEPEAWLGRGLSRMAQGDIAGGALDVQHARDLAPAEPAPLVALGDIDVRRGQLDAAVSRYRAALTLSPDDGIAWLKLGNALARKAQNAEARAAFERALALRPGLAAAHNGLGTTLLAMGDSASAERSFAAAAELDASDPNPLRNLALLYARRGDMRAARGAKAEASARAASL